jgi:4'-phosphopantetheinyl transferase
MQYPIEPVVLFYKIDFTIAEMVYLPLLGNIRKAKREKIERFKFREDKLRCLYGEILLKYALDKYFNIEYEKEVISEDELGKPHLSRKQISFNLSHSGNWVAVVCYINDAGIDIERIEKPPYEIMPGTFTQNEINQIENCSPQAKAGMFYKIWTLKESYIKMLGKGLSIPLDSFSIDTRDDNTIGAKDNNRPTTDVHFRLFSPDSDHISAVCMRNFSKEISPYLIHSSDLIL